MNNFWDDPNDATPGGLLNIENVEMFDAIWWVGDRADVNAMTEAGFRQTVALTGSLDKVLKQNADDLKAPHQIVLCLPSTSAGRKLQEDLAARMGRHRCWTVSWPPGCLGAHATAISGGSDRLAAVVHAAAPYPITGMQRIKPGTLALLRVQDAPGVITTGTRTSDRILQLPEEGRLIVVTGWPGAGKSNWTRFVMIHIAANHNRRWAVFSPEMQPWEHFAAECAEVYHCKPFWSKYKMAGMTDSEVSEAERWLSDRVVMLVCDAEKEAPTLDWIFDLARVAVLRDGVTDLLIDPWNEVDHQRGDMSETDYIGRSLQRLKSFALRHGCNVWIVAHPAKPPPLRNGEKRGAPGPYDIAASAHWANKPDIGITVHSPVAGEAEIHLWKTRFRRWGRRGDTSKLDFDEMCGVYRDPIVGEPVPQPRTWRTAGERLR